MPATAPTTGATCHAVLYPAIAEAAWRSGANRVGLIDLGGHNLDVDRTCITYSDGQSLGDPSSPVHVSAKLVGDRAVPARAMPEVVARIGVDRDPVAALADVPADALPVVITTWALSRLARERRLGFLDDLGAAAANRTLAWVSAEGVGVAPAIPTLGDRRAFGHSIVGLAMFERSVLRAEALGRCWSRGRWLEWLAD